LAPLGDVGPLSAPNGRACPDCGDPVEPHQQRCGACLARWRDTLRPPSAEAEAEALALGAEMGYPLIPVGYGQTCDAGRPAWERIARVFPESLLAAAKVYRTKLEADDRQG
jgi:hypothetical protein